MGGGRVHVQAMCAGDGLCCGLTLGSTSQP